MAKLSNSPKQALNFDLERRKSFTFRVRLKYSDGSLVNLTGCILRFVMKSAGAVDDHFDLNNLIVNSEATIGAPHTGEGVFAFQAAELDGDPGEYGYSIVLWSPDNFSTVLAKGVINLLDNSESHSMHRLYSATAPTSALELTLRGGDVVEVEVVSLPQVPVSIDAISWPDVGDKPESFPPSTHGHTINEVTGLANELAGKQPAGNYAASVHQHTVSDVNGLQGALDGKSPTSHNHDGTYAPATHGHTIANVTGLQTALDGKADSSHGHTVAQVTGLQGALDGKQPAGSYAASTHTHTAANITDFTEAAQDIVGSMVAGAGGTYNDAAGTITLPSGGGGGGAVDSVAGRTGAVVLSSADLTDSTATGRSVLTAADAAAARSAIGAGTSNLAIGTTGTTAAAGNRQATATAIGMVELATTTEATTGTDTSRAVTPQGLKAAVDAAPYVKTVNGVSPDGTGDVSVAGGGGSAAYLETLFGGLGLPMGEYAGQGTLAMTAGRQYAGLFRVPRAITITGVDLMVNAAAAGGVVRAGIYKANPTSLAAVGLTEGIDLGTIDPSTQGTKMITLGTAQTLSAGLYAMLVTSDVAPSLGCALAVGAGGSAWSLVGVSNNWRGSAIFTRNSTETWATTGLPTTGTTFNTMASTSTSTGLMVPFLLRWGWAA